MPVATVTDPGVAAVLRWFDRDARPVPWRATRDVYAIWVAEVMSAQTSVARAAAAWERWIERWPTVAALAAASPGEVLAQWQGLGYPRRARDLHRSARIVAGGGWPADLTELPGVGPYVAAAIRCFALEQPVLPVDVNVARVLARRFPDGVQTSGDPWRAGQALMEFGQRICTARPACDRCPVAEGCPGRQDAAAGLDGRARPTGQTRAPARSGPRGRRAPFEGSLRQRRGRMLARVLADGEVAVDEADAEAAAALVADGLLRCVDGRLRTPEERFDPAAQG